MSPDVILTDTHCHLDFPEFDQDREYIIRQCLEQHISTIVVPGVSQKHWPRLLTICHQLDGLYPALGLHPCFLHDHQPSDLTLLAQHCESKSVIAIGEIGLDFYVAGLDRNSQRHYFSEQLQIARQYQLPVLIHARKSHDEILRFLKSITVKAGIIHAYSGSYEQAKEYLKLGFKLGFGGAFTYPRATRLRSLVARLPLDAWVLETDAPDMSPVNHRGQRNSPRYLTEIASTFIDLYDNPVEAEQVLQQLQQNAQAVFQFH